MIFVGSVLRQVTSDTNSVPFFDLHRKVSQTYYHTVDNEIRKLAFRSPYKNKAPTCVVQAPRTDKRHKPIPTPWYCMIQFFLGPYCDGT